MSVHSIAEMYAVLTRLPVQPRIHPAEAVRIITDNILPHFEAVPIGKKDYVEALKLVGNGGWSRAKIYGSLLMGCAARCDADWIYTFNSRISGSWLLPGYKKRYARREIRTPGSGRSGIPSETLARTANW